jgi:hypothetical protein
MLGCVARRIQETKLFENMLEAGQDDVSTVNLQRRLVLQNLDLESLASQNLPS